MGAQENGRPLDPTSRRSFVGERVHFDELIGSPASNALSDLTDVDPSTQPAKGSLLAGDGALWNEFPAGTDGQVLSYDSTQAFGLRAIDPGTSPVSWSFGAALDGEAVAPTGTAKTVQRANASSGSGAQDFVGLRSGDRLVQEDVVANAQLIAGLTLANGDRLYLSKTAGALTNDVSAFVTGDRVIPAGYVRDASTYVGGTPANSKASVLVHPGVGVDL